jgi:flagellar FliL protein
MNLSKSLLVILIINLTVAIASIYINYQFFTAITQSNQKTQAAYTAQLLDQNLKNALNKDDSSSLTLSDKIAEGSTQSASEGERKFSPTGFFSSKKTQEFLFYTVEKLIVSVNDDDDVRYFIIDLVLQASEKTDRKKLSQIEPAVRSALVSYLSDRDYNDIRSIAFNDLQANIEKAIFDDFSSKGISIPFTHVLVSKLIAQ